MGLTALLAIPWLWPWTAAPSNKAWPLMASWACLLLASPLLLTADPRWRTAIPASWAAAAVASAAIGLLQWSGTVPAWSFLSQAAPGEAYGNLRQRNHLASLTSIGLLALLWFHGRRPGSHWFVGAAVLALGNAATGSRTGLLQWACIAALAWWPAARRQRLALCGFAIAVYGAGLLLLPSLMATSRAVQTATALDRSFVELGCHSRTVLWANVVELIAQRPWTGWGWGQLGYAHYIHPYAGARFCDILHHAHNLPLHIAVEGGLPLAAGVLAALGWVVLRARPWAERDPTRQLAWGALAMIGLHSLVEYPLWYGPFQLATLLCVLLLCPPAPLQATRLQPSITWVAAAGLACLAWVAYVYDQVSDAYRPPEQRRAWLRHDPVGALANPPFFAAHVRFAELAHLLPGPDNAAHVHALARDVIAHSPEPVVIRKLIESALLLGRQEEALAHEARFRAAFPQEHARWLADRSRPAVSSAGIPARAR